MSERKIEILDYSPEVQDVLGRVPSPILKITLTVLILIVVIIFIGSIVFRYPDTVTGEIKISSSTPTQVIVAQTAGYLDELDPLRDKAIQTGDIIASIQNTVDTQEAITLKKVALRVDTAISTSIVTPELLSTCLSFQPKTLGSLSDAYNQWIEEVQSYLDFIQQDYRKTRINLQRDLIELQSKRKEGSQKQAQIMGDRYLIAKEQFRRDSLLHTQGILSDEEYESAKALYKQAQHSIVDFSQSLISAQQGIVESEISLSDLEKSFKEEMLQHHRLLASYTRDLLVSISNWEKTYLLLSPISGTLNYWGNRYNHQYVQVGEPIFSVDPLETSTPHGSMTVTPNKAGKIAVGQKVLIRLSNYPDEEFGFITGEVANISTLPDKDGNYRVDILLPKNLTTSYGRNLPIQRELQGTGEIVTANYRLIERFIMPIRKMINQRT
ncbi:MAG: HlyD family efflux transporter periplasmic adaptor subunit [Porphyromonas sp.]|uniref:HlyD family efflux transporter periplasmic adaptor subunit n=1 Tax=Porphyromonas sp. TaxID=1924944 RepID=UPI002A74F347|nr:HlyD family efflux transporter periplasmic adaptor subunit [Porphyromonas sp.]MDY3112068.1 HlyD family efflux transporter periplasmic adaptor subunit [Porphyromonas sp.]